MDEKRSASLNLQGMYSCANICQLTDETHLHIHSQTSSHNNYESCVRSCYLSSRPEENRTHFVSNLESARQAIAGATSASSHPSAPTTAPSTAQTGVSANLLARAKHAAKQLADRRTAYLSRRPDVMAMYNEFVPRLVTVEDFWANHQVISMHSLSLCVETFSCFHSPVRVSRTICTATNGGR